MTEKKKLILLLGSNFNQESCISEAMSKLEDMFNHDVIFSRQLWTNPIEIESDMFLNCIAFTQTAHKLEQVKRAVKNLEHICGNTKRARNRNIIKMDIDILQYDNQILHERDWTREYVKELLKDSPF